MKKLICQKNIYPSKISLCYNTLLSRTFDENNYNNFFNNGFDQYFIDPIKNLLLDYEEIKTTLDIKDPSIFKFLFFIRNKINFIIFNLDEIIYFDSIEVKKELNYYFYLSLLIKEDSEIVNYLYPLNFIEEINNLQKYYKDKIYSKLILSKIIIELIKNYKESDKYEEGGKEDKILKEIYKENLTVIENNINFFQILNINMDIKDIIFKKIDEIYIDIIKGLIKENKFYNYEYIYDIIKQLDLENIEITKTMFDELSKIFSRDYIRDYLIVDIKDLFVEKNINFYFILLKYILKSSIYICKIPMLLKIRNLVKNWVIENDIRYNDINEEIKDRFEYILLVFSGSEYYFKDIPQLDMIKLEEILNFYKTHLLEYKQYDIKKIENIIDNKKGLYKKYFAEYEDAKKIDINSLNIIKRKMRIKEKEYYLKKKYLYHHHYHLHHFHPHFDFEDRFDTEVIFEHPHPHLDFEDSFDEDNIFKHHYHPEPRDFKEMERYKYLHHKNIKISPNREMIYKDIMKERYKDIK